jgi:circadian clock protein KaiC
MGKAPEPSASPLVPTGVEGLDDILGGGLPAHRLYLVEGDPGSGKTTLALQFLLEGVRRGEPGIYVTLSETEEEIRLVADSHGLSLEGVSVLELAPSERDLDPEARNTMFQPSEIELGEATQAVLAAVERVKPVRMVLDSLTELRLLAETPLRYRRQILALKKFFAGRQCTALLVDDRGADRPDVHLQSVAHGVLSLERHSPDYGVMRRRLQVMKLRGREFRAGYHDYAIRRGGLRVYPRLVAAEHFREFEQRPLASGIPELDKILGGGVDEGTSVLLMGPAGSGKSALATQYAVTAAARGEKVTVFTFDESLRTFLARSGGLGQQLKGHMEAGRVTVRQIDPAALSAGEFAQVVREAAEGGGARVVIIDSLNGYLHAMPETRFLLLHLHELLMYLGQLGVTTFLTEAQHGLVGNALVTPAQASYLADTVLLLRFFEASGEVRQAISVMKKRGGRHERTVRELRLESGGIRVGTPLREFQGVLTGVPTYVGESGPLLGEGDERGGRPS